MKRSTRSVAVSQAFKVIDSESRKDIRDRRLDALEADNFIEEQTETNAEDFEVLHTLTYKMYDKICIHYIQFVLHRRMMMITKDKQNANEAQPKRTQSCIQHG